MALAAHWASARPTSRGARRNVRRHFVVLVFLAASHLGCRDINRNQKTLDPNLALALLRKDAGSILALKEGRTAKLDLVVSNRDWPQAGPFYEGLVQDGVLQRKEDTTTFERSFGTLPARSFALAMEEDARDVTRVQATLILLRPAFSRVIRVDQQGKIARVKVEITNDPTRTLQWLFPAARLVQKPANVYSQYWWEHLPSPETMTQSRTYVLYSDQRREAVTRGWGMFASGGHIKELFSENPMTRASAATRLGELGEAGAPGVPFLIDLLADTPPYEGPVARLPDGTEVWRDIPSVSGMSRGALRKIGEPAVEPLLDALSIHANAVSDRNSDRKHALIATNAIRVLGEIGDRRAAEPLANLMQTCAFCRNDACIALRKLRDARSSACPD